MGLSAAVFERWGTMATDFYLWNESRLMGWEHPWREDTFAGAEDFMFPLVRASQAGEPLELIKYIDPYGETVFNRVQMPTVIAEFERLSKYVERPFEKRGLEAVLRLARICETEVHHYLVFIGD
jgi:hypothetical protein